MIAPKNAQDINFRISKKGNINNNDNKLIFSLFDGFKLTINDEIIQKLSFDNYKIEFPMI